MNSPWATVWKRKAKAQRRTLTYPGWATLLHNGRRAERERDTAIARAETAERERDEAIATLKNTRMHELSKERQLDKAIARAEKAEAALVDQARLYAGMTVSEDRARAESAEAQVAALHEALEKVLPWVDYDKRNGQAEPTQSVHARRILTNTAEAAKQHDAAVRDAALERMAKWHDARRIEHEEMAHGGQVFKHVVAAAAHGASADAVRSLKRGG